MELSIRLKRVHISTFPMWLGNYYHVQIFIVLRLRNVYIAFICIAEVKTIFHIFSQILRVDFHFYNRSNSILDGQNNFFSTENVC